MPKMKNVPACPIELSMSGLMVRVKTKIAAYPEVPTKPSAESTATSEQYSQVMAPEVFWKQKRKARMAAKAMLFQLIKMKSPIRRWQIPMVKCPPMNRNLRVKAFALYKETHDEKKLKIPIK